MTTEIVHCNRCGAALQVASTTNFVTCNHCGTNLAIRRSANATFTEAAGDKALQMVAEHLGEISQQNEMARIDREWQIERENYMIADRYGRRSIPSPTASVIGGFVVVAFGIFWTIMAFGITSGFPAEMGGGFAKIFPLFGIIFIIAGAGFSIYAYNKAQAYREAYQAYQRRRQEALRGQKHPGQTAPPPDSPSSPDDRFRA
jgi:hypothetical protein